ncbi:MAG: AI-2E family transporter [Fibrobacteraceae bacterium]|nr:AI-2E family transporter [Fibrobacteraceae bacterium]
MLRNAWTLDRVMRVVLIAAAITLVILLVNYLQGVLFPFFAAFLMAYIADPLVNKLQTKVKHRIVAVIIVLLGACCLLGLAALIFIPQVIDEIHYLGFLLSKMITDSSWMSRVEDFLPGDLWETIKEQVSWQQVAETAQSLDFWNTAQGALSKILPGAWGVISKTTSVLFWFSTAALIFMYLVFIMYDMPKLRAGMLSMIPRRYKRVASEFASETDRFMGTYFRSQSLVALMVGVLYSIGFGIMGLPMGVAFGLFSGALNMVPYLQLTTIPLALVLAIIYALNTGMPFWEVALIVAAIYLVVQIIEDFLLVPKVIGKSMNLPPVGILLSVSIWGKLLGFLGLLVAIPFTCLCLVYMRKIQKRADDLAEKEVGPAPEA